MNKITQLLHRQLWSRRTSWIIFAVLIAVCTFAYLFADWVTPRERRLIQETINKADNVPGPEILSSSEFEKQNAVLLQLADKAASMQITERDKVAALLLRGYVAELSYH
jgi:vancomycin permeability regulator SanA